MEEKNTVTENNNTEKTFTQDEVNSIVQERLARERSKEESVFAEREQQLIQRELQLTAKERLHEMGMPVELVDALNVSSQDALEKSMKLVGAAFAKCKGSSNGSRIVGAKAAEKGNFDYMKDIAEGNLSNIMKFQG